MNLSIIIVNWNSAEYLRKCLISIFNNIVEISFEIIVVDNGSYDGSESMIRDQFPVVKFVQSKDNLGFARANNLGYSYSSGDVLLFLNPDTEVIGSAVNVMYSTLQSLEDAGTVGCRLLNSDLSLQLTCVQRPTTILKEVLLCEYFMLHFPKLKLWGVSPLFFYKGKPEPVEAVSGACIMIKREVFEEAGKFNEEYFMYVEDIDLCRNVRKTGHKVYYVGDAQIIHYGGQSAKTQKDCFADVIMIQESTLKYLIKNNGKLYAIAYRVAIGSVAFLRLIILKVLKFLSIRLLDKDKLQYASRKWSAILFWSIGIKRSSASK
jgi:N-acetylglucosaminyl-diphospho-decaprenol L-rhamnosyltransferase